MVRNERRELDPQRPLGSRLTGCAGDLRSHGGIAAKLEATLLDVRARDVQLVAGKALGILQYPDYLDVVLLAVAENVSKYRNSEVTQGGEFLLDEGPDTDVLQADRVEHARGRFAETRGGCPSMGCSERPLVTRPPRRLRLTRWANSRP